MQTPGFDQLSDTILSDVLCGAIPVGCFPMSMSNYGAVLIQVQVLIFNEPLNPFRISVFQVPL